MFIITGFDRQGNATAWHIRKATKRDTTVGRTVYTWQDASVELKRMASEGRKVTF